MTHKHGQDETILIFGISNDQALDSYRYVISGLKLMKIIPSPIIHEFPFNDRYIRGVFQFEGNSVPIISLNEFFGQSVQDDSPLENLVILNSGGFRVAICNLFNLEIISKDELVLNENFFGTVKKIFDTTSIIKSEFQIASDGGRAFLLDSDQMMSIIKESIENQTTKVKTRISSNLNKIILNSNHHEIDLNEISNHSMVANNFVKSQADNLQIVFRIANQGYSLSSNSLEAVIENKNYQFKSYFFSDHYLGIVKTIYGSAHLYDLRLFLGASAKSNGDLIVMSEGKATQILIVDEVIGVVEKQELQIINSIYPLTNTSSSIYDGLAIANYSFGLDLIYVFNPTNLIKYMQDGSTKLLGINKEYEFYPESDSPDREDVPNELICWIGGETRIGISISFVEKIIHDAGSDFLVRQTNSIFKATFGGYGELSTVDLHDLFNLNQYGDPKVIIVNYNNDLFALIFSGDITINTPEKLGNVEDHIFNSIVVEQDRKFIVDYANFNEFIGYLVNPVAIAEYLIDFSYDLLEKEISKISDNFTTFLVVGFQSQDYFFPIEDLISLEKTCDVDAEYYSFESIITGEIISFGETLLPKMCMKLKGSDYYYVTDGEIDVVQIYDDEIDQVDDLMVEGKTVQLPTDKKAIFVNLR